jgi:hypothetical protein
MRLYHYMCLSEIMQGGIAGIRNIDTISGIWIYRHVDFLSDQACQPLSCLILPKEVQPCCNATIRTRYIT